MDSIQHNFQITPESEARRLVGTRLQPEDLQEVVTAYLARKPGICPELGLLKDKFGGMWLLLWKDASGITKQLEVDPKLGLTTTEDVARMTAHFGANQNDAKKTRRSKNRT